MLLQLLRKWIKKRLGFHISIVPAYFCEATKDGALITRVLHYYNIISTEEAQLIEETKDPNIAHDHFNHIQEWLQRIDIELSEADILEITHAEASASAALLYEMYMRLENQSGSIFRAKSATRRFEIKKVKEFSFDDIFLEAHPLCEPLLKQWDIINWEKDHLASLMAKYVRSKEDYKQYLEEKRINELTQPEKKQELEETLLYLKEDTTDLTYAQLIEQQKKFLESGTFEPNQLEAKKILKQIKNRNKERTERAALRLQFQHQLLGEVWKKIEDLEEEEFDSSICDKLLRQSLHEKEIAEKLLNIRRQKDIIMENRKKFDAQQAKRGEEEFVRKLFEEELETQISFHDQRMKILEEHQRLYEERLRLKSLKHQKLCKDVVNDLVDLALKTVEYKKEYKFEPDAYTKRLWASLFIKQQQILDFVPEEIFEETLNVELMKTIELRREILDEEEMMEFLRFENFWQVDGLDQIELGMNCLGFAVHRVLLKKYPFPIPQKPNLSSKLEIAVCVSLEDLSQLEYIRNLLQTSNILIFQMADAIKFCEEQYDKEINTEFITTVEEKEDLKELSPRLAKTPEKKKKKEKPKKTKKDSKKKEMEVVTKVFEEREAQTPRFFPWEKIPLSKCAKLGKIAKEFDVLDDQTLVEILIEFLMRKEEYKGWVLVNYVQNYQQAALLEQALSGKMVPQIYFAENLNRESLTSLQISIAKTSSVEETIEESIEEAVIKSKSDLEKKVTITTEKALSDGSSFTAITIQDDWSIASQRIADLLPDLKDLAYSSEDEVEVAEVGKECICHCQSTAPIPEEKQEVEEEEETEVMTPIEFKAKCHTEATSHFENHEEPVEEIVELPKEVLEDGVECICIEPVVEEIEEMVQPETVCEEEVQVTHFERPLAVDLFEEKRKSKFLPNPRPPEKEEYHTVLTAYIKLKMKTETNEEIPILKEMIDGLEKFYCDQGCYYLLEYEEMTRDVMKSLAKTIIGDYSLPLKNSIELFGEKYKEGLLQLDDHVIAKKGKKEKKEKKAKKPKTVTKSSTKIPKKKKSKVEEVKAIATEDKEVQVPVIEESEEEEVVEPKPGELLWDYIQLPIPEELELALAEIWETIEDSYVKNLKQLFYVRRNLLNNFTPFVAEVDAKMREFLRRPDQKQCHLNEFLKILNETDLALRADPETKSHILCLIDDFCEKLMDVCDTKMRESEEQRQNFVKENYFYRELGAMTNIAIAFFQSEMDRFLDCLQFLVQYYSVLITKNMKQQNFGKEAIPKFELGDGAKFNEIFIDLKDEVPETEFHDCVSKTFDRILKKLEEHKVSTVQILGELQHLFDKSDKKNRKLEIDDCVRENSRELFDEFQCAIEAQFVRMNLVCNSIKNEFFTRLNGIISWLRVKFLEFFHQISWDYEDDIRKIHQACSVLAQMIQEEKVLIPQIIFGDQLIKLEVSFEEDSDAEPNFTLEQLEFLVKILQDLGPSGFIPKTAFLLLLQDVLNMGQEFPEIWRNLSLPKLNSLLTQMFDNEKYLYWKDFIVCNLKIPFPTRLELQRIRAQFRNFDVDAVEKVSWDEFQQVHFFDDRIKWLLYKMYQTEANCINYTAMLLDFCKDEDQVIGFVKALELSFGKFLCVDENLGAKFVEEVLANRNLFEEKKKEHEETIVLAKKAVSLLIDQIVDNCETPELTLTEVEDLQLIEDEIIPSMKKFSPMQIGFESRNDTELCHFLPLELVLVVVDTEVTWNSKMERLESKTFKEKIISIYEDCRREDFNDMVLTHDFLNKEELKGLLGTTHKFYAQNPIKLVKKVLEEESEDPEEFVFKSESKIFEE